MTGPPHPRRGWLWLGVFWGVVVGVLLVVGATVQWLGPPLATPVLAEIATTPDVRMSGPGSPPRQGWDGRITSPDPALQELIPGPPPLTLPKVGPDGRLAMQVYARPADRDDPRPKVAIILSGFGLAEAESRAAIAMPGPVDFAVSLFARQPDPLLMAARAAGHELLASIPMESQGYPIDNAGQASLMIGASPEVNRKNLQLALSHVPGAVGATGASDWYRGERFAAVSDAFAIVPRELAQRGLLYVDPRPGMGAAGGVAGRGVDFVLDEPPARAEIEAKLSALERRARERGSALGLVGRLQATTIERIADWAKGLESRGIVLVPVSAIATSAAP